MESFLESSTFWCVCVSINSSNGIAAIECMNFKSNCAINQMRNVNSRWYLLWLIDPYIESVQLCILSKYFHIAIHWTIFHSFIYLFIARPIDQFKYCSLFDFQANDGHWANDFKSNFDYKCKRKHKSAILYRKWKHLYRAMLCHWIYIYQMDSIRLPAMKNKRKWCN